MAPSAAEWERFCVQVRDAMALYVWGRTSAIACVDDGLGYACIHGTGNYVAIEDQVVLLTAEHVVDTCKGVLLHHHNDDYVNLGEHWKAQAWPVDVAINYLGPSDNGMYDSVVSPYDMDDRCGPVQGELLFWVGYPGSTATRHEPITDFKLRRSWFGQLDSVAVPMLSQGAVGDTSHLDGFDSTTHMAVHYPSAAVQIAGAGPRDLLNPAGMSGSFLWDTNAVAATNTGIPWNPGYARICGLVQTDYRKSECVSATRIEHVRGALLQFIREERAYITWEARGRPHSDALTDWLWAEKQLRFL